MLHPSRFWWIACAVGAVSAAPAPVRDTAQVARARVAMARLPMRFESNQGQWNPKIRFQARAGDYTLALTDRGAVLGLRGAKSVEIAMLGANPAPAIEPSGLQTVRTNYFVGSRDNWHTGVANYSRVQYRGVYPGIDVVYYGSPGQLEYDFVMAPGADARAIRMDFRGADSLRLTPKGDLELETAAGRVVQQKPSVYQDGRAVEGSYVLLGRNLVGVRLGAYDRARALVIDPALAYATYMGGVADDEISVARIDAQGRLYVAGFTNTSATNLIATPGAFNQSNGGQIDTFIAIIDTTGGFSGSQYGLLYLTYIGGAYNDIPTAMQVDGQGNIYVAGNTTSINFPQVGNTIATAQASYTMGFVFQLNPAIAGTTSLLYSTYVGGSVGNTLPQAVDVDAVGNIYVFGTTQADDFPVTASAYQPNRWGTQDMFLAQLNPAATVPVYATYLGGELEDEGYAMAVSRGGLVYFAGSTESTQFPLAGFAHQGQLVGNGEVPNYDLIIGVIDPTKFGVNSLVYSTYLGGSDNEQLLGMTMDAHGNLVLTGYTFSPDFPVTADAAQPQYGGNGDAFVTVVNPNTPGFVLYSTFLGGSDAEVAYAASSDSNGAIYVTGYTLSSNFPLVNSVGAWGGLVDVFVTKLQPGVAGSAGLRFSTFLGAQSISAGTALALRLDGAIFVGGFTGGQFPVTPNAWQSLYGGGGTDAFVMGLTQTTSELVLDVARPRRVPVVQPVTRVHPR
jgi:hypothetical protein